MHEQEFCTSFQPPVAKVFGVWLDTYAIGHELALIRQGNPLVTYSDTSFAELPDNAKKLALTMAIEICGKLGFFTKWIYVIRTLRADPVTVTKEIQKFRDYRKAGSLDLPLAKMSRPSGVPFHYFGAPELARLLNFVTERQSLLVHSHFNGSPLNFPLGLAQILLTADLEKDGHIWVKNFQDMERERPPKPGTPPPGLNEKILTGEEAEQAFAEAAAKAEKGNK